MTEARVTESGEIYLVDWNGSYIVAGTTVLHAANEGHLYISKVVKIYQKPATRQVWNSKERRTVGENVIDTLVRLEPLKDHPLNGWKPGDRTINSRLHYVTFNSLTRFEVSNG